MLFAPFWGNRKLWIIDRVATESGRVNTWKMNFRPSCPEVYVKLLSHWIWRWISGIAFSCKKLGKDLFFFVVEHFFFSLFGLHLTFEKEAHVKFTSYVFLLIHSRMKTFFFVYWTYLLRLFLCRQEEMQLQKHKTKEPSLTPSPLI